MSANADMPEAPRRKPGEKCPPYSSELGATICARIEGGETIRQICQSAGMPGVTTLFRWLRQHQDFAFRYRRAQRMQAETGNATRGGETDYAPAIVEAVCDRILAGQTLRQIGQAEDMPSVATLVRWLSQHSDFAARYAHAKEVQADLLADDVLGVADDPTIEPSEKRVRIDARKWTAAMMRPKKYGKHPVVDTANQVQRLSDEELRGELLALAAKAKARIEARLPAPPDSAAQSDGNPLNEGSGGAEGARTARAE